MVQRVGRKEPFCCVGGGALNRALVRALDECLKAELVVPNEPQSIGALGAAIEAWDKAREQGSE